MDNSELTVKTPVYRERSRISLFVILMVGIVAGAVAFQLLAVPAIRQGIYQEANQQIVQYSESLASQGAWSFPRYRAKQNSQEIQQKK